MRRFARLLLLICALSLGWAGPLSVATAADMAAASEHCPDSKAGKPSFAVHCPACMALPAVLAAGPARPAAEAPDSEPALQLAAAPAEQATPPPRS